MSPEHTAEAARVAPLCARLRARGDADSVAAAREVEGTLEAFAVLVADRKALRERLRLLKANHSALLRLWSLVPTEARQRAAHGAGP